MRLRLFVFCFFLLTLAFLTGCQKEEKRPSISSADSMRIVSDILWHRKEADAFFQTNESSPFLQDSTVHFDSIKWFPPDVNFVFTSKLFRYIDPKPVTIFGTRGEERKQVRYGYFVLNIDGRELRLNVYKSAETAGGNPRHLSVWFTDRTTGKETYNVGRYLEVGEEQPDPEAVYTINFNNAYNPYCAYTPLYSCAIPTKDDYLDAEILAGEKKYHP